MRSIRLLGMVIGAVCALSAVLAGPVFAASTNNPGFLISGSQFMGTTEILAEANGNQLLESELAETITCSGTSLKSGATIENDLSPLWGLDHETIVYTGCVYGAGTCKVATKGTSNWGTIETLALASKNAFLGEKEAEKESLSGAVTVFTPASGETFTELEFSGTKCPILTKVDIKGSVVAMNTGTPYTSEATHELEAPSTAITKYFYNEGGKTKEGKAKLTAFGGEAKYVGKAKVMLSNGSLWSLFN
jgi:hypothetical protein